MFTCICIHKDLRNVFHNLFIGVAQGVARGVARCSPGCGPAWPRVWPSVRKREKNIQFHVRKEPRSGILYNSK